MSIGACVLESRCVRLERSCVIVVFVCCGVCCQIDLDLGLGGDGG